MVKSAIFEVGKPLEMGPDLQKFRKKISNQPFFEVEKSLDMGRGFRTWATHPRQKIIRVPPPPPPPVITATETE